MPNQNKKQHEMREQRQCRTSTLLLVYMALVVERADAALLPAVYKEIGVALQASLTALGSIALCRSIVQAACYPLAAYMAVRYDHLRVIALGAFLWAAATLLVGLSSSFLQMALAAALNGVGLALQIPAIYSFVADSTDSSSRGLAFGWLLVAAKVGTISGSFLGLLLARTSFMGFAGWRIAFFLLAILGVVVGMLIRSFAIDHHLLGNAARNRQVSCKPAWQEVQDFVKEARAVMRIPSFQIIVAQGLAGSFLWSALSFTAMWLELVGFSHQETAFLLILLKIATSLGALFGGKMGDVLAKRFKNSGRIVLAQISAGSAVPLAAILMLALPNDPTTTVKHAAALFVMGIMTSWNASATNSPILAEIVPQQSRTSIYALDRTFEAILASFAPPVVGILAEHMYGYKLHSSGEGKDSLVETERHNATSLAKALYTAIAIPMTLCCFIYSFLYCTYPRDRERAQIENRSRAASDEGSETDDDMENERKLLPH